MPVSTHQWDIRDFIKWLGITFAMLLALLILLTTLLSIRYYYQNIMPFKTSSELLLSHADPAHRPLPEPMAALLDAEFYCPSSSLFSDGFNADTNVLHCGDSKSDYTARLLIYIYNQLQTALQPQVRGHFSQSIHHMLLSYFVKLSLSSNEQNTIISELSYFDSGIQGASNFSKFYFHKPLASLSTEEAAILTAFIHSPRLIHHPQALKRRQQILLHRHELMKR